MILRRFLYLLFWRLGQVELKWWLLLALIIIIESFIVIKQRDERVLYELFSWCIFIPYIVFILVATVFSRSSIPSGNYLVSFDISTAWTTSPGRYGRIDTFTELCMNILMFVPIGFLLMKLTKKLWLALGISFLITLSIEVLQLITKRGFFELADILLNFFGAVGGLLIYRVKNNVLYRIL